MKIRLIFISLICCYLLLVGCQTHHNVSGLSGKVQRVISGQTLEVFIAKYNKLQKVRLIGIEAPDLKQIPWGLNAKSKLSEWLKNEDVVLEIGSPEEDKFGRQLAYVWHNGELINEKLIKEGYVLNALEYEHKYSDIYQRASEYARLMQYGIWDHNEPLRETPSEFRAKNS
jgi:micrococcal nuclease